MRPGSISKQYRDRQRQRGVYYQLSYTHEMRSRTEHVWPDHVKGLRKEPLQQNLWVPRRRDSPRILTSNKLYPILMGIKVVATSQLPIQTSDLRGQRLRRDCPW